MDLTLTVSSTQQLFNSGEPKISQNTFRGFEHTIGSRLYGTSIPNAALSGHLYVSRIVSATKLLMSFFRQN